MYAVMAILAALAARERTGEGRLADISMLDGQLSLLSYQAVYATVGGMTPKPQGSRHDSIPTYRSFTARDGREFVVAANTQRMWRDLCGVLDVPGLAADSRFVDGNSRLRHQDDLAPLLERAVSVRDAAEWVDRLAERSVPAALIKTVPEALADAGDAGRGMIVPVTSPSGRVVETIATPIRYRGSHGPLPAYPPRHGADTGTILAEAGYSPERIAELLATGAVAGDRLR
jgi:crotonobetainyl-CoA:carnitine CoA-transferase CaiB-like acyl-CoA transferase